MLSPEVVNVTSGVVQATLVTATGYPFDFVKGRLQAGLHKNAWECIRETGFKGLYRGSSMPWISHLIKRPIQFVLSERMKANAGNRIWKNYYIGGVTSIFGSTFGTPLQRLKIMAQTSNKKGHISQIWQNEGLRGFYRGFIPTAIKDSVFGASFVGTYYTMRGTLGTDKWWKNFANGASAHCLTWFLFIPIDYVKTNVQKNRKATISGVLKDVVKNRGILALWKGVLPACLRTIPVSGVAMTGYELTRKKLTSLQS